MTESTQLQTTENNNTGVVKMEAPPPPVSPSPSEQQYALKWNDFQTSILSSFRHLRDEEDFVDVTLACDQRSFTAHKVVLSACSPYFRKLLKANPCEHPIVILRDVRSEDVESLLRFMYNGEVHVGHEQLSDFLKTAQLLQVRGLADVNNGPLLTAAAAAAAASASTTSSSSLAAAATTTTTSPISTTKINSSLATTTNATAAAAAAAISAAIAATTTSSSSASSLSLKPVSASVASSQVAALAAAAAAAITKTPLSSLHNNIVSTTLSSTTPAVQELKASPNTWGDLTDDRSSTNHLTPPPQKRIKSADLYRAQHGISPERLLVDIDLPIGQHPLHRERDRHRERNSSRDTSRDRDRSLELRDTLLGQALENAGSQLPSANQKHQDLQSLQAQSTGEDSNSSDTEPSDRGDGQDGNESVNGSMDRSHSFPSAFLGLQGIPGLLPGPSGMHGAENFGSRRSLEMRVRATDPRPCPKCGKIYRSAHTLRTHLEDKHTVCPGYRCVLCGTVAKSRNSLHSHMSRQHRGISTKDLPVLPMPSPFDPELASRLLAKAGVKISAAELRARASPTSGTRRGDSKLDLRGNEEDDDPEDLTTGSFYNNNNNTSSRYDDTLLGYGHPNTTITRIRHDALNPKNLDSLSKDLHGTPLPPTSGAGGQSLLDTYLQFITENTFGMGMTQEHAAAALHAAKMAQLNAMGHGLDKLPPGLLPPHLDLAKISAQNNNSSGNSPDLNRLSQLGNGNLSGLTIEPSNRRNEQSPIRDHNNISQNGPDIRRELSEPMDLGLDNNQTSNLGGSDGLNNNDMLGSDAEDGNYSDDDGGNNT